MVSAHSVHAAAGRRGRRAEEEPLHWRCIEAPGGSQKKLAQGVCASGDVSSDQIGVFALHLSRRSCRAGKNLFPETWCEALHLRFDAIRHVIFTAVWNVAVGPCGMATRRCARRIEETRLREKHKRPF